MAFSFPALDFPLYGLVGRSDLPRWLESVDGPLGRPATGVWLRHGGPRGRDDDGPWVRVASLRRDRYARTRRDPSSVPRDPAYSAMLTLVDATMPKPGERPDGYETQSLDLAEREADGHEHWPRTTWAVGETSVPASVFTWAGAWAGFTAALPSVDVVVVGFGIEPDEVALAELAETSAYYFDGRRPIRFPETLQESRLQALGAAGVAAKEPPGLDP